jgi:Protein of unknown function (DUF3352)
MGRRGWILAVVMVFVGLVLAGCGSSGGVSTASPAQLVPGNALAYIELTVRPQGSQSSDAQSALTRLVGHNPVPTLQSDIQKSFSSSGLNYKKDIQPWLGQRIAIAVMGLGSTNVALIAPTNNQSAALSALQKGEKNAHLTSTSYRGVNYQVGNDNGKPVAIGIVGHDAVAGGPAAFKAVVDASHGGSLSGNQTFNGAFGAIDSNAIMRGYLNGSALLSAVSHSSNLSSLPPSEQQALQAALQTGKLRGGGAFGLTLKPKTIIFEVHSATHGSGSGSGADVSGLPEGSWLALATGAVNVTQMQSLFSSNPTAGAVLNLFRQRYGVDLVHDVLPALGPIELAVQGTALPALQAGLSVTPSDAAAGSRVLGAIFNRLKQSKKLSVQGKPTSFSITKAGTILPRGTVEETGGRILATFDEAFSQFTSPSSTLSSNPAFGRAKSALPSASKVPFFVDFSTLSGLTSQIASFQSGGSNAKDQAVLERLDYLVLGSNPGQGDVRFVLGLR